MTKSNPFTRTTLTVPLVPQLSVFKTSLGWMALLGAGRQVTELSIGHPSPNAARAALLDMVGQIDGESDWHPALRKLLTEYAQGKRVEFDAIEIAYPAGRSEFCMAVLDATRAIPYGGTLSYQDLAWRAGSPRAARAVGTVMRRNRLPILIPCHRVVAAQGIGGYSAASGIGFKQRLLDLEAHGR